MVSIKVKKVSYVNIVEMSATVNNDFDFLRSGVGETFTPTKATEEEEEEGGGDDEQGESAGEKGEEDAGDLSPSNHPLL